MTESQARQKVVSVAEGWYGRKEADGSHRVIIDIYNNHKPLARNYKVKYTDAWCATFGSAAAIVAGYTELMGNFIHANPGLESRFNKYFYFEDYDGKQLAEIFRSVCKKNGYTLDEETDQAAAEAFQVMYDRRDENFGNARDVRNIFEAAVARQANRVAAMEAPGKEELMALTAADLDLEEDGTENSEKPGE